MSNSVENRWWEKEIPRLRVMIEELDRRLDRMGFWGPERRRVLEEKTRFQFELDNALRAAELHEVKLNESRVDKTRPGSRPSLDTEEAPKSWDEVEISFISDERVQIRVRVGIPKTYNYTELGFEDRRTEKQNFAWLMLRQLAESHGALKRPPMGKPRATVQKRLQEIRNALRKQYEIKSDPIPFNGVDYATSFKISWRRSVDH